LQTIKLFISEGDGNAISLRQQLSTTSFEAFQLEIAENNLVHHLNGECQFHAKFHELISAFLAWPPDWAWGPPPSQRSRLYPRWKRSAAAWLPVIVDFLQQTIDSMLPSFQPLLGNSLNSLYAP